MLFRPISWIAVAFCALFPLNILAQIQSPYALRFGTAGPEHTEDMCVDQGGNYVFAFSFETTLTLEGGTNPPRTIISNGLRDSAVAKFDFIGNVQWALNWGNALAADRPMMVACDRNSNVYVAGVFAETIDANPQFGTHNLTSNGDTDVYLIKFSSTGNFLWAVSFGGAMADFPTSLKATPEGTLLLTMAYRDSFDADPNPTNVRLLQSAGGTDIAMLRLNAGGGLVWANSLGGVGDDGVAGVSTQFDSSGNTVVLGTFQGSIDLDPGVGQTILTSLGANDVFLARYDVQGKIFGARQIGGAGNTSITKKSLGIDPQDNPYVLLNFDGSIDVDLTFGTRIVTSQQGSVDILLASYTKNDVLRWNFSLSGIQDEEGRSLHVDRNGNVLLGGLFRGVLDLDPGSAIFPIQGKATSGASDAFAAKYRTADGAFVTGVAISAIANGPANLTQIVTAELDTMGNLVLAGSLFGTDADFDPTTESYPLSSAGSGDVFLAAYNWRGRLRVPTQELERPVLRANTNGASFLPGGAVPGGIGTLFGLSISTKTPGITKPDIARTIPVGTKLCNTEVIFHDPVSALDYKAPILFCSDFQINYQVPTQLPQRFLQLKVVADNAVSNDLEVLVLNDDVGLFMENFQQQLGALVFAFGPRLGQKMNFNNSVTACDILEIYVTGLGDVLPSLPPDGNIAGEARPARGDAKVVLFDDGTKGFIQTPPRFVELRRSDGFILYTGISPNFVGLYQVNMEWPNPQESTTPSTLRLFQGDYPAYVEFNGKRSLPFIIPVRYSSENPSPCRVR